jgi:hypothetical protein
MPADFFLFRKLKEELSGLHLSQESLKSAGRRSSELSARRSLPLPSGSGRVSSETSLESKQPKLEPKLVSALSETTRLFWLFCFNIETGSFGVSKQPKQTKDQP